MIRAGLAVLAILFFAGAAKGANQPHPVLDAVATEIAGKPVSVWCETSRAEWERRASFNPPGTTLGYTVFAEPVVYLSPTVCSTLRIALLGTTEEAGTYWLGLSILTLAHEAFHQKGIVDEQAADCAALAVVRPLAVNRFRVPETVTTMQPKTVTKTVVKRVNGRVFRIPVKQQVLVPVTTPNPTLAALEGWARSWHGIFGPPC